MLENHETLLKDLKEAQQVEKDNRKMVREADLFINKRDGQWEPEILESWSARPRYTFDQCNPVIDSIMAEMDKVDFAIAVDPAGGDASKEVAGHYGGIIRNIENISKAPYIYNQAARVTTGTGLAGWRIKQAWRDADTVQQDLIISEISNFKERVWFDADAVARTMEDSMHCWVLTPMSMAKYLEKWPKGSKLSVGDVREANAYTQKKSHEITVGEHYYRKKQKRTLLLLSNNSVVVKDENFEAIKDEYAEQGITVLQERDRDIFITYHRLFDGGDFLNDDKKTVFEHIPVIPVYANFGVSENKVIYWGAIEKLMDPQRVLNYAESKKTAESSLKPIEKTWVSKSQAKSADVRATLASQNTNSDPIQFYDFAEGQPPPYKPQVNQPDSVLIETAQSAQNYINKASGLFDANRGQGLANQSGEAISLLQNKGDSSNYKYFMAMEVAITHTCKILIKAIPSVYDTKQEMRVIGEDGTVDSITIKEQVYDEESGKIIEINDLSKGSYDVSCSTGPAFQNKQQEMVENILKMAAIDQTILPLSADILLNNMPAPGMDKIVERKRMQMLKQGLIPDTQQTEEEKAFLQQQQQSGSQPSAIDQANLGIMQAEMEKAQANTRDILSKINERQQKMAISAKTLALKQQEMMLKLQTEQQQRSDEMNRNVVELIMKQADQLKTNSETLKILKEAMGADTIITPGAASAYETQIGIINDSQQRNVT